MNRCGTVEVPVVILPWGPALCGLYEQRLLSFCRLLSNFLDLFFIFPPPFLFGLIWVLEPTLPLLMVGAVAVATIFPLLRRLGVCLFLTLIIPLSPTLKGLGGIIIVLSVPPFSILEEFHDVVQFWLLELARCVLGSYSKNHRDEFFVRLPEAVQEGGGDHPAWNIAAHLCELRFCLFDRFAVFCYRAVI